jgi:hypothetical protein
VTYIVSYRSKDYMYKNRSSLYITTMTSLNNNSTPSNIGIDIAVVLMYKGGDTIKKDICICDTVGMSGPPLTLETHFSFDSVNSFSDDPSSIVMSDVEVTSTNKASIEISRNPTVDSSEEKPSVEITRNSIQDISQEKPSVEITRNSTVNEIRYISKERLDELEFIEKNVNDILRCAVDDYKYTEELKSIKKKITKFNKRR